MPRLKMLRGPEPGLEISLDSDVISIGRGRRNDVIIQDNEVSRMHCRLVKVLDDYEIHDLKSTNGTFINGQKVDEGGWLLSGRCIVELGDSITFEYVPSDIMTGTSVPVPAVKETEAQQIFYLVIVQESVQQLEIYVLDRLTITMGRDMDNDIVLREPEISRHHLRLVMGTEGYKVEDLNTMNGTQVNGRPLNQQRLLRSSDQITVGTGLKMWFTEYPDQMVATLRQTNEELQLSDDSDTHQTNVSSKPAVDDTAEEVSPFSLQTRRLDEESSQARKALDGDVADNQPDVGASKAENLSSKPASPAKSGVTRALDDHDLPDNASKSVTEQDKASPEKSDDTAQPETSEKPRIELPDSIKQAHSIKPDTPSVLEPDVVEIISDVGHGLRPNDLENAIFLAYARTEWQTIVGRLYAYLEDNGFNIFAEQYLTPNTSDWEKALRQAQAETQCLLAIITEASMDVPYVQRSIRHFIAREKPVLLVQVGNLKRAPIIIQSLPAIQFDRREPDKTYRMILAELRRVGLH